MAEGSGLLELARTGAIKESKEGIRKGEAGGQRSPGPGQEATGARQVEAPQPACLFSTGGSGKGGVLRPGPRPS